MTSKTDVMLERLDAILTQLEALGVAVPSPTAPETRMDAHGNPGLVAAGELIESAWGNAVVGRVVQRFPNITALNAWAPGNGAIAGTVTPPTVWIRQGGTWIPDGGMVPSAKLGRNANQAIPNATLTAVTWQIQVLGNFFNATLPGTGLVAPYSGLYNVTANVNWDPSAQGQRIAQLMVNGALVDSVVSPNTSVAYGTGQSLGTNVVMTAGQAVSLQVLQDTGGAVNIGPTTALTAVWMGLAS